MRHDRRRAGPVTIATVAAISLIGISALAIAATGDDADGSITAGGPGAGTVTQARTPAPGSRITLGLDNPVKPGSHYLWIQTIGPPLDLGDATGPKLRVTVPAGADALGFLLIVGDDQGIRTSRINVPIAPSPSQVADAVSAGPQARPELRADAGDDQIGLVGRRITLNGSESRPRRGVGYRWIQLTGPEVRSPVEADSYFSFVPGAPGLYRFALVVASENRVSAPDHVNVTVGLPPAGATSPGLAAPLRPGGDLDLSLSAALFSLDDAGIVAGPLAGAFENASARMDLYQTYAEIYSELSRRLDAIMPQDPYRRARWNAALFEPLTQQLIARMVTLGLDLRYQAGQSARLSDPQKQELRSQFDRAAKILRSVQTPR